MSDGFWIKFNIGRGDTIRLVQDTPHFCDLGIIFRSAPISNSRLSRISRHSPLILNNGNKVKMMRSTLGKQIIDINKNSSIY